MKDEVTIVWVIRGAPLDPEQPMHPCTVHDMRSRRLRYQHAPRGLLKPLGSCNGMAKFTAVWKSHEGTNGRWELIEQLPANVATLPIKQWNEWAEMIRSDQMSARQVEIFLAEHPEFFKWYRATL